MSSALSSFIKDPKDTEYDGEDRDEKILYVLRRSSITNLPWFFATGIMLVAPFFMRPFVSGVIIGKEPLFSNVAIFVFSLFWYLVTFGFFYQNFLNWFFNVYIITNKKIVDVDYYGLTYKNISEAALANVEDVTSTINTSFGMIFNIGHVYIQTAGERREFDFEFVYNPSKVRDIITDLAADKKHGRI